MKDDTEPLTKTELERDAHDCFYVAVRAIGERVKAGEPLPAMFVPSREWAAE